MRGKWLLTPWGPIRRTGYRTGHRTGYGSRPKSGVTRLDALKRVFGHPLAIVALAGLRILAFLRGILG